MREFDKVSAKLSSSLQYCGTIAENAINTLVIMYHEAMSTFWGQKICCV